MGGKGSGGARGGKKIKKGKKGGGKKAKRGAPVEPGWQLLESFVPWEVEG